MCYAKCHHVIRCPRRFLNIVGQNPSASNSNQLHVVNLWNVFINMRYSLHIPLKRLGYFLKVLNSDQLFLKLNEFICN